MTADIMTDRKKNQISTPLTAWLIWGCAASFYFYQFILRVSPSIMIEDIMADLGLHGCAAGSLFSMYYWGYTLMQVPVGLLLDRIGLRKPLTFAIGICVAGVFLFATGTSILMMSIGRFMIGAGSAFAFLSSVKAGSLWFRPQQLGLVIGLTMLLGTTGATVGGAPISMLSNTFGWREALMLSSVIGVILTLAAWTFVKERKGNFHTHKDDHIEDHQSIQASILSILTKPQTYVFGLYGGLMYVPLSGFADLWGVPFISQSFDVDQTTAAGLVSFMYIGIGAGAPLCAWLADYFQSHKKVLIGCGMIFAILCTTIVFQTNLPFQMYYVIYFLAGLFGGSQFMAFACVCLINPHNMSGTASAVQNMINMASGIIFQPIIGLLLDLVWDGKIVDGKPFYTLENFTFALTAMPVCLLLAILLSFRMRETYPRKQ